MLQQPTPVQPQSRIEVIDVIRGFALFGVLAMNMAGYSASYMTGENWSILDQWISWLAHFFIEAKFYSIFSFLFGLGMAMQMLRAEERGTKFLPVYIRRLLILLLIGVLHATFLWTGDILLIYALCGFLLLLFRKLSPRTILIAALIALLHPLIISLPGVSTTFGEAFMRATQGLQEGMGNGFAIYTTGSYFEVTRLRFWEGFTMRLVIAFAFGNVFAMFLLGLYAGKRKLFQNLSDHLPTIRRVMWITLVFGVLLNGLYVYFMVNPIIVPDQFAGLSRRGLRTLAAPTLCFFYITTIILLHQKEKWQNRLHVLAPLGRMALTNYLLQSLIATLIFYGYGLGWYGNFTPTLDLGLTLIIYALQIRFSMWWLERYRFGPAEWVWRSLTYGKRQPLRIDVDGAEAAPSRVKVAVVTGAMVLFMGVILWHGYQLLPEEDRIQIVGVSGTEPTPTLALPTPRPTATPIPVATLVVEPVSRSPGPAAVRGDLWDLALAFDEELALADIETLTGPPYLGRYAGSPGGRAAGDTIAQRFETYGLRPAGDEGTFFQSFPFYYSHLTAPPDLTVIDPTGTSRSYRIWEDFAPLVLQYMGGGQAEGPAVWANNCGHDDFNHINTVGKVVLCWDRLWLARQEDVGRNALEHGAVGLLLLSASEDPRPFDRRVPNREVWVPEPIPAMRVSTEVAQKVLSGTGFSLDDLTIVSAPFPFSTTVRLDVPLQTDETILGRNVLGVLPGRDPAYADEVVILGAHYDHVGETPDGTIWPGANDNASGVAVLLETVRAWQEQGYVPRRTVLFAAWDAEEISLDGSRYYVAHPQYPLTRTMAMLQLDMVGAGEDTLYIRGRGSQTAKLETLAHTLNLSATVIQGGGGSDHVPFMEAQVPANMLIWFGEEESIASETYHRPADISAIIQPDKLAATGWLTNLALLALVEGEPAIFDLLAARQQAVNNGSLAAFLQTGATERRELDTAWFDGVRDLPSASLAMDASNLHIVGRVATATVKMKVTYTDENGKATTESANLPVRFVHQQDGWYWAGPALAQLHPPAGFAVAFPAGDAAEAVNLSQLAQQQYLPIAEKLGLSTASQAQLILYPDHQALRADTRLTLPHDTGTVIERNGDHSPLVKMVMTPQLSQTQKFTDTLVQLALAEAGVEATTMPWLWQGLPMAYHVEANPLTAQQQYLPSLFEALISNSGGREASPLLPESFNWAAVEFLREQVGWDGIGQLALALGNGASADEALTQVMGVNAAEFDTLWRSSWQTRLSQVETGMAALFAARRQAVLAGDETAFLDTVDPTDPILLAEERDWFATLRSRSVELFELSGQPQVLLADGSVLVSINQRYKLDNKAEFSLPLTVKLTPAGDNYRWAGPLFDTLTTTHMVLRYPLEQTQLAGALLSEAEVTYQKIISDLAVTTDAPLVIKLYDDDKTFRVFSNFSGQSVNLFINATNPAHYRQPLARELTYAFLPPLDEDFDWFREGLALVEAGRVNQADARDIEVDNLPIVARAMHRNQLYTLDDLSDIDSFSTKETELAYTQSWDMVRFLVNTYGLMPLQEFLHSLRQGKSFALAFSQVYGLNLAEFETQWRDSLARGHVAPEWIEVARQFDATIAEQHIAELTGPDYAGRQVGMPGEVAAAAYIADQFARYGLMPAGDGENFVQPFPITYSVLTDAPRLWSLNQANQPLAALKYRQDFVFLQAGAAGGGRVEDDIIWIRGEDYGSVRLGGKVALRMLEGPVNEEIDQAVAHGAGGLILVGTRNEKKLWPKVLVESDTDEETTIPVVELTQDGFKKLLATAGYVPTDLHSSPPAMPLDLRVLLSVPLETQVLTSANVLGLLPGYDPNLREEVVILGAHYDHVGDDPDDQVCLSDGDCIDLPGFKYQGVNDDASVVAVLLETARLWQEHNYQPARTVLFAAWGAEELDRAGSDYYVAHPMVPLTDTITLVQMESVGGGRGFRLQSQSDSEEAAVLRFTIESAADQVEARLNSFAKSAPSSDHESFRRASIPTTIVFWEKSTEENLPVQYDDEIDPQRLGQAGRSIVLTMMSLSRD